MSIIVHEYEYVDRATEAIRYLEHGWPSDLCRWHSHREYELHLVAATRGLAFVGDHIGAFGPGDLFLTGPDLKHNWITDEASQDTPVEIRDMLVQFHPDTMGQLAQAFPEFGGMAGMWRLARRGIRFAGFDPDEARAHFETIRESRGVDRIVAFIRFLARINAHEDKRGLSVETPAPLEANSKQARIGEVVNHISRNHAERLTLEEAADMAGMSPAAFSRNFRKATGSKFVEFVNRVRIGQACAMLYATDEQVSSICHCVGFQNLANFNRQFMRMKRTTPSAYRRLARAELAPHERGAA